MPDIKYTDWNFEERTVIGADVIVYDAADGSGKVAYTYGEAEEVTVDADFSDGDMIIEPATGKLFSRVTVTAPADGGGGLVDYRNELATTAGSCAYSELNGVRSMKFVDLTTLNGNAFSFCADLEKLDFYKLATIKSSEFMGSSKLTALIIRTGTMCKITETNGLQYMFKPLFGANPPIHSGGTGFIYVPSSLVETYQTDANWSRWATQFRAIEDYPDICG